MYRQIVAVCLWAWLTGGAYAEERAGFYEVRYQTQAIFRTFEGQVDARDKATMSAETSGRVEEVLFDVGDEVPAGSVILRLAGIEQQEQLNQAQAALAEAKAASQSSGKHFARIKAMYDKRLVPKSDYDTALAEMQRSRAQVDKASAGIKSARQQLGYTEVRAVYSGVVSARHVEVGEAVQPGMALMSGFNPQALRVVTDFPHSLVELLKTNPPIRLLIAGEFLQVDSIRLFPLASNTTGMVRAYLNFTGDSRRVYPGERVKVEVQVGEHAALLVPESALVQRSEVTGLYVQSQQGVVLRQVRTGRREAGWVEVLAGLREGDRVRLPAGDGS